MSTKLAVGDKLTMTEGDIVGEMIVTSVEKKDFALFSSEGDRINVEMTLVVDGKKEYDRYQTYFDANNVVDGKLLYNEWTWSVE